jgi:hypothetical protein
MILPCGAGSEPLFELASTVLVQGSDQGLGEWDCPLGGAGLDLMQRELAIHRCSERRTVTRPWSRSLQSMRLAPAQPDAQRYRPQPGKPMRPSHGEEPSGWRASQIPDRGPNKVPPGMEDDECRRNVGNAALSSRLKRRGW